jgi:hypothetical protein
MRCILQGKILLKNKRRTPLRWARVRAQRSGVRVLEMHLDTVAL